MPSWIQNDVAFAFMALIAIAIYAALALFGRIAMHRLRTGDSGLRIHSPTRPPAAIWATLLMVCGCVGVILSICLVSASQLPVIRTRYFPVGRWAGLGLAVCGILLTVVAQRQMGNSWRIGCDEAEQTALVTHGLFRWVRNPIYTGMMLFGIGVLLLSPTWFGSGFSWISFAGFQLQVRGVEEPLLRHQHGDTYLRYAERVGRFLPWLGRAV